MARIVTVYWGGKRPFAPIDMSVIRWLKISEALAELGHEVDLATAEPGLRGRFPRRLAPRLRRVPLSRVRFEQYDVVKTLFHLGFRTLAERGGAKHPFVISKLGSVVDRVDRDGVYFHGAQREALFGVQEQIARSSRYVTVLSEPSRALWHERFGDEPPTLFVPGAVDDAIPPPSRDPYGSEPLRCLFAGNLYNANYQPQAHRRLVASVNELGRLLVARGIRLYLMGPGDTSAVDRRWVSCLGSVPYTRSWDAIHFADVGVVLALGPEPNHNESTKIYHYLRAGLPVVCESGFPNQGLISEVEFGAVSPNGDMQAMAQCVEELARRKPDPGPAVAHIRRHHTWRRRAEVYDATLRDNGLASETIRSTASRTAFSKRATP